MLVAPFVAAFLEVCTSKERKGAGVHFGARLFKAAMELSLDLFEGNFNPQLAYFRKHGWQN